MNLATGGVITRYKVWERPATELVIQAVEKMAEKQGCATLKITGRHRRRLEPTTWTPGVAREADVEPDEEACDIEEEDKSEEGYDDKVEQNEIDELFAEGGSEKGGYDENNNEFDQMSVEDEGSHVEQQGVVSENDDISEEGEPTRTRQSQRTTRQPDRLTYMQLVEERELRREKDHESAEYRSDLAPIIAHVMVHLSHKYGRDGIVGAQQHILQKGLKLYGGRGESAVKKEISQLSTRKCFEPINIESLSTEEKRKAVDALMFLSEKRDGTIKGRMVYNGKPTREWLTREETASPTVSLESTFLTVMIDAKEGRDVMTNDVPNAFYPGRNTE